MAQCYPAPDPRNVAGREEPSVSPEATAGSGGTCQQPGRNLTRPGSTAGPVAVAPYPSSPKVLRDYAFVADGQRGALIDSDGRLAWMCFPGWADPAVLAGLLGPRGEYQVVPATRAVPGGRYEDGTLIWHSRWVTDDGIHRLPRRLGLPGEEDRAVILRRVSAVDSTGPVIVRLNLAGDYGRRPFGQWRRHDGRWVAGDGVITARWSGAPEASIERGVDRGLRHWCCARPCRPARAGTWSSRSCRDRARPSGRSWTPMTVGPAPRRRGGKRCHPAPTPRATVDVRQSFAVLRGMTGPDGGTVAAATTSLPERSEAERNYDYRYCWVRDICYIGHAGAAVAGGEAVLDDAVRWVSARLLADGGHHDPGLPAPTARRSPTNVPRTCPAIPAVSTSSAIGYDSQFQLDLFGEALLLLANAASRGPPRRRRLASREVGHRGHRECWSQPENGIWETEPARGPTVV